MFFICKSFCCRQTHWQQSVMYIERPTPVKQSDVIRGSIRLTPNIINNRSVLILLVPITRSSVVSFYFGLTESIFGFYFFKCKDD